MKVRPIVFGMFAMIPAFKSSAIPRIDGKHVQSHKVMVEEVVQTTSYTYLHVKENDTLKWLAVPKMAANSGETYYYSEGLSMKDFESKELHKKFDEVLFLGGVSPQPFSDEPPKTAATNEPYTRKATVESKRTLTIDVPQDCITISELLSKKDSYAGKTVKIKGQVTKYSPEIMNKNWIHLQDGTENNGKYDLIATSTGNVKTGDVVIIEGKVTLNKDFGYGYSFEVMIEEAVIK